jgi:hypothetical protein
MAGITKMREQRQGLKEWLQLADARSPENKVAEKDAQGIDEDIAHCPFPKWDEGLMVLVGDGVEDSDNCRDYERFASGQDGMKRPKDK